MHKVKNRERYYKYSTFEEKISTISIIEIKFKEGIPSLLFSKKKKNSLGTWNLYFSFFFFYIVRRKADSPLPKKYFSSFFSRPLHDPRISHQETSAIINPFSGSPCKQGGKGRCVYAKLAGTGPTFDDKLPHAGGSFTVKLRPASKRLRAFQLSKVCFRRLRTDRWKRKKGILPFHLVLELLIMIEIVAR